MWSKVCTYSAYHSNRNIQNENVFKDPKSYQSNFFSSIVPRIYHRAWMNTSRGMFICFFFASFNSAIAFLLTNFKLLAATVMDRRSILFLLNCWTNFATSASIKKLWVGQRTTHGTKKKLRELLQPFLCFCFRGRLSEEKRKSFGECFI